MRNRTVHVLRFIIVAGALSSMLVSCQSTMGPSPTPLANPCTTGTPPTAAIVCIDDSDLTVKPPANPNKVEGKRKGAIQWFTVSGTGSIGILFDTPDVLRDITCKTNGHCIATVLPNAPENRDFKYTIVLQKGNVVAPPHDPFLIIKP